MRECGILLPISSLPSNYGIGSFSKEAYEFVDTLKESGQQYWQILPLGPTGYGDSPYQAFSSFAGNPYFIDLEQLIKEGLLTKEDCDVVDFGDEIQYVNYEKLHKGRFPLLRKAYECWKTMIGLEVVHEEAEKVLEQETREYCLYMAIKNHFESKPWILWDEDIKLRKDKVVKEYQELLSDEIGFYEFQQIKFQEQWEKLKEYANKAGIKIIGDIPIYVAFDGSDSWANPELFQFDETCTPLAVAGCPPDGFSKTGQLWGNPLYDWGYHKKTKYQWWMIRMTYSFRLYDVVRVDHFRGFDEYYAIPYGDETAEFGAWEEGPGIALFEAMEQEFGTKQLPIIAEDLGFLTPSVLGLLEKTGFPGMKVLEFAFDSREENDYLPHNYGPNCVVYTGTHDNDTILSWYDSLTYPDLDFAKDYMGNRYAPRSELHWDFIRLALSSVADLAIIPMQDYLGLGTEARINTPSTLGMNWRWRMVKGQIGQEVILGSKRLAQIYGRLPKVETKTESVCTELENMLESGC